MNNTTITVTLPLSEFDTLRDGEREYRRIADRLSRCFTYKYEKSPECDDCQKVICPECEVYKTLETLTVDVERLIQTAKDYALYRKDVETELDGIKIIRKGGE